MGIDHVAHIPQQQGGPLLNVLGGHEGKLARPGWSDTNISCALYINDAGELEQAVSVKSEVERGKKKVLVPKRCPKKEGGDIFRVGVVQVPEHIPQVPLPFQFLRAGRQSFAGFEMSGKFPASKTGLAVTLSPPDPPLDDVYNF